MEQEDWINEGEQTIVIYGIGHDVLDMKRMETLMTGPHGEKFIQRVLTQQERALAAKKGQDGRSLLPGVLLPRRRYPRHLAAESAA